jgi:photosystem II stability/assembly factor-like uncharacterized protein
MRIALPREALAMSSRIVASAGERLRTDVESGMIGGGVVEWRVGMTRVRRSSSPRACAFRCTASLGLLLAVAGCGETQGGGQPTPAASPVVVPHPDGWEVVTASPQSPGTSRHEDLAFVDPDNGWLVNARGEVHATRDGGATWTLRAQVPGVPFRCLAFADRSKGWIGNLNTTAGRITPDSALWETEDGGVTWSNISARITGATVVGLCGMRALTPRTVVAVGRWGGPPVFVKTTDGGRTWLSRSLEGLATGLVDVTFRNEDEGFAVGGLGVGYTEAEMRASRTVILATTDGGVTWQTRYTSAGLGQWAWKIQFVTERIGYVTTEGPAAEGVVLKTVDGGATWSRLMVAAGMELQAVGFVDPARGWVGAFPTLFSTTDGGASWSRLDFGTRINRMRVVDSGLVYAAGDRVYRWGR